MTFSEQLKAATIDSFMAIFTGRKMLVMFLLGFSSGYPLMLTVSSLTLWFYQSGIEMKDIGLLSLLGVPYTFKYLWAPLVDRFGSQYFGRRKSWILSMQLLIMISVFAMSLFTPDKSPFIIAIIAFVISLFSATQDIAFNAYQADVLAEDERAIGSAVGVMGYRVAMLTTGALLIIIVQELGGDWQLGLKCIMPFLLFGIIGALLGKEGNVVYMPKTLTNAVIEPFKEYFSRGSFIAAITILLIIICYKLGDAIAFSLNTAFFASLGFDNITIAVSYKTNALVFSLIGIIIGGMAAKGFGLFRTFLLFSLLMALANLMYLWLALMGKNYYLMVASVAVEYFVGALGTSVLVAMILSLVNKSFSATQFAIFSSIDALGRVFIGPFAGYMQQYYGWAALFFVSFLVGIAVTGFIWLNKRRVMTMANLHG
ncbi:MAG: AmpG family muropeptide MFS transporter [Francisellaceae bacterium]